MKPPAGTARRLLLILVMLAVTVPALPQTPPGFTVEIIVFRNGSDAGALDAADAPPRVTGDDVEPVSVTSGRLGGSVPRLNRNGLRVLGHAVWQQEPSTFTSRRGVSATRLGLPGITGKVMFLRERYLALGVDLLIEDGGKRYRINQLQRQVKTDQIYYFDQAAIGVLAIITAN